MTVYKSRTKSTELIILELLYRRNGLTMNQEQHYFNLVKGYEGEIKFDQLTEQLHCDCLILNDLLLHVSNTTFQIDSLIVVHGELYLYEVKNLEGDYCYESDQFFKKPNLEVNNPLHQLVRSESLLRQLLLRNGFNFPILASVVFINPTFTLYQAPLYKPIIHPTQVQQHMKNLNSTSTKLTAKERKVAEFLLSRHNPNSPYERLPSFSYQQLQKGIICARCFACDSYAENSKLICRKCGAVESVTEAVLRSVLEFKTLFPSEKITTSLIHDWCEGIVSKWIIRKILMENFDTVRTGRWTHYK